MRTCCVFFKCGRVMINSNPFEVLIYGPVLKPIYFQQIKQKIIRRIKVGLCYGLIRVMYNGWDFQFLVPLFFMLTVQTPTRTREAIR